MKNKTIKQNCRRAIDAMLSAIPDHRDGSKEIKQLIKDNIFITGGAITSLLQDEQPKDYDCYFKDKDACFKIAEWYVDWWKESTNASSGFSVNIENRSDRVYINIASVGVMDDETDSELYEEYGNYNNKSPYMPTYISSNAISLKKDGEQPSIQFVIRFSGTPDEVHKNYDFVHTKNYYDYEEDKLKLYTDSLQCIMAKELRYMGSMYPLASLFRIRKFIKRGWTITALELFKIAFQVNKLDLTNPVVLQEQLMGVDYYYFNALVDYLTENPDCARDMDVFTALVGKLCREEDEYEG